jgi:hypothetical protein
MTDEGARKKINGIIPDLVLQVGHLSRDEKSLAGCDHLADTKTLNGSKQHFHKKISDFGFALNLRQTEVKSDYRKKAGILDAEYHQPGDATTFKSILNGYGKGGEVLCLVVGYSILARPRRIFIVLRTWLPRNYYRSTSTTPGRRRQSQRRCKPSAFAAPGVTPLHVDSRGSSWIVCGTTWTRRPALATEGAS